MSTSPKPPQIIPYLFYRDVPAALDFLTRAFGFKEEMRHRHAERRRAWRSLVSGPARHDGARRARTRSQDAAARRRRDDGRLHLSRRRRRALRRPPRRQARKSCIRRRTSPMAETTRRSIPKAIPGSSPRRRRRGRASAAVGGGGASASKTIPFPPPPSGRRDDLDRFARLDLGLGAAGQDFDAAVVAADGVAAEFAFAPAHHARIGRRRDGR